MKSTQRTLRKLKLALVSTFLTTTLAAWADINVGVLLSLTGPGA